MLRNGKRHTKQGRIVRLGAAALAALTGCQGNASRSVGVAVNESDSAGVRIVTITGSVESLPTWSLAEVPLTEISGSAPPYLSSVGEVAFFGDEELLVYDQQSVELRLFGSAGQELRLLAGPGDGPADLRFLEQISVIPGDTIYGFDTYHGRFLVFGPDGSFVTSIPVDRDYAGLGASAWALDSRRLLLFGVEAGELDSTNHLPYRVIRDRVMQVVSDVGVGLSPAARVNGEFSVRGTSGVIGSPFSSRPFVSVKASRILHGSGMAYELVIRDFELRPLSVIRWLGWQRPVTSRMLDSLREGMYASVSDLRSVNPEAADELLETLFHPAALPESLPDLGSALLDEDGRIWVARFQPMEDLPVATTGGYENWREEEVWHVLGSDGIPIARVRLPSETRLHAVRRDRVAVVSRDSLGVEHVRVLELITDHEAR